MKYGDYNEEVAKYLTDAGLALPNDLREVTWMAWSTGRPLNAVAQALIGREKATLPQAIAEPGGGEVELNLSPVAIPSCKHCGRQKGNHLANTLHCPIGRGSFPSFHPTQVYEPRTTRKKTGQ